MTHKELAAIARGLAPVLKEKFAELEQRLETRIKALETAPQVKYCGTWTEGTTYAAGALTTRGGSLWLCIAATVLTPGTTPSWRLIVKKGEA